MKIVSIILLFISLISACGTEEQESSPDFTTGGGPVRGHEDLTRIAIDLANEYYSQSVYPSVSTGTAGFDTNHPIVKGNYHTDFPTDEIRRFNSVGSDDNWHTSGHIQNVHALSNYNGSQVESSQQTCQGVRRQIKRATQLVIEYIRRGEQTKGFYWSGHALHTLQDSFSHAHTERSAYKLSKVDRFCTYGVELVDGCFHSAIAHDDRVWQGNLDCQLNPNQRGIECLKEEARMATEASAGYLLSLKRLMDDPSLDVSVVMDQLFDGSEPTHELDGFLNCAGLGSQPSGIVDLHYLVSDVPNLFCGHQTISTGVDLNKGAGGKFINICYGKGREKTPINGLSVVFGKHTSCPSGWSRDSVDLNSGAGGDYIFLCSSRGTNSPLQDLRVVDSKNKNVSCPQGFTKLDGDLNKGAGGRYIFMCIRR